MTEPNTLPTIATDPGVLTRIKSEIDISDRARIVSTTCPACPSLRLGFEYHRKDQECMTKIDIEPVKVAIAALLPTPSASSS